MTKLLWIVGAFLLYFASGDMNTYAKFFGGWCVFAVIAILAASAIYIRGRLFTKRS